MPISSRKLSASILTVGCRATKSLIGSGGQHHDRDRRSTTAAIMTDTWSTMPTAVITESSENTMSSSMIWTITLTNDAAARAVRVPFLAFEPLVDLERALGRAGTVRRRSGSGRGRRSRGRATVKSGVVSLTIQASENSSRTRVTIAPSSPSRRARRAAGRRQLSRQDRDEDDVVDAEDDFEERERREGNPDLRVGHPVHEPLVVSVLACPAQRSAVNGGGSTMRQAAIAAAIASHAK